MVSLLRVQLRLVLLALTSFRYPFPAGLQRVRKKVRNMVVVSFRCGWLVSADRTAHDFAEKPGFSLQSLALHVTKGQMVSEPANFCFSRSLAGRDAICPLAG